MKKIFFTFATMAMIGLASCASEGTKSGDKADAKTTTETKTDAAAKTTADATAPAADAVDPNLPTTTVKFENDTFDLGDMKEEDKKGGNFKFTNTGSEPLIISSAKGSCGCTVPQWPKEPIAPGESGEIAFEFNAKGKKGQQTKTITIQANTDPNPTRLTVKGNVLVPEAAAGDAAKAQ